MGTVLPLGKGVFHFSTRFRTSVAVGPIGGPGECYSTPNRRSAFCPNTPASTASPSFRPVIFRTSRSHA